MSSLAPSLILPSGARMPRFGLGTWRMGESPSKRAAEVAALKLGLELGVTLIDTAEMYGEGEAETIVADAVAGRRGDVFIVSKVYPHNAGRKQAVAACERSLKRLETDRIDLYLLHWRGGVPLAETLEAFAALKQAGKIRDWGVSNFDTDDMMDLERAGGSGCACNQILYNPSRRAAEHALLDICEERKVAVMAYSPIEQGRILRDKRLAAIAKTAGATPAQICLAWLLRRPNICVIPKATSLAHLRDNLGALDLTLSEGDLAAIDAAFPPPRGPTRLDML